MANSSISNDPANQSTASYDGALILIVEDNPVERLLESRILSNAGFAVMAVESGEEAMAAVAAQPPSLILLDALLPDIDGFEVCRRLRRHPRGWHIPVVMLTGLDDVGSIDHAYEVGAVDFVREALA